MKKIEMKAVMLVIVSIFITSGMVWAQGLQELGVGTNYGVAKLGYFMPNDDDEGLEDFDSTFNFGVVFGRFFTPEVSVEAGLEYYSTSNEESGSEDVYYGGYYYDTSYKLEATVSAIVIPVTAKYHLPLSDILTGYIGGGIGIYLADAELKTTVSVEGYGSESESISDDDTCFGFHFVAGADYAIRPNLSVGGEFKWSKAEASFEFADEYEADDVNIGGITISLFGKMLF